MTATVGPIDQPNIPDDLLSRRVAVFIPPEKMVAILSGLEGLESSDFLCEICLDLPPGTEVIEVHYSFMHRAFCVIVANRHFEKVEEGRECPTLQLKTKHVDLRAFCEKWAERHGFTMVPFKLAPNGSIN